MYLLIYRIFSCFVFNRLFVFLVLSWPCLDSKFVPHGVWVNLYNLFKEVTKTIIHFSTENTKWFINILIFSTKTNAYNAGLASSFLK